MKRVLIVMLSCTLYACSQAPVLSDAMGDVGRDGHETGSERIDDVASQPQTVDTQSRSDSNDLLLSRQRYCLEPLVQRHEKIARYKDSSDPRLQLEQLLLMSCELTAFNARIYRLVDELREVRDWSPEDLAFLAFLKESTQALRAAEAKRYALQVQLEDTIQGITHIEEAIDARGGDHHLAEE